jgi:formylglycine-generating enzyme required for sulfatase activity
MSRSKQRLAVLFSSVLAFGLLVGCGKSNVGGGTGSGPPCETDEDCAEGEACFDGDCVEVELTIDLGGGVTMELVRIRAGTFMMGSDSGRDDETPVHSVTISRDFYIGRYQVTRTQWQAVMGSDPSSLSGCGDCPVANVSWDEVVTFCDTVATMTGYDLRLPTEAEWEYACRAGTTTEYSFGDDGARLGDYGWYIDNSDSRTHEVGGKLPNPWGLYDMHGNVLEWCSDWYSSTYYSSSPGSDPTGPEAGSDRVERGGQWGSSPGSCRSANRSRSSPDLGSTKVGFRCALGTP